MFMAHIKERVPREKIDGVSRTQLTGEGKTTWTGLYSVGEV